MTPCPRSHCLLHSPAPLGHYFTSFYTSKLPALCPPGSVQPPAFSLQGCILLTGTPTPGPPSEPGAVCFPLSQHPFPSPYIPHVPLWELPALALPDTRPYPLSDALTQGCFIPHFHAKSGRPPPSHPLHWLLVTSSAIRQESVLLDPSRSAPCPCCPEPTRVSRSPHASDPRPGPRTHASAKTSRRPLASPPSAWGLLRTERGREGPAALPCARFQGRRQWARPSEGASSARGQGRNSCSRSAARAEVRSAGRPPAGGW